MNPPAQPLSDAELQAWLRPGLPAAERLALAERLAVSPESTARLAALREAPSPAAKLFAGLLADAADGERPAPDARLFEAVSSAPEEIFAPGVTLAPASSEKGVAFSSAAAVRPESESSHSALLCPIAARFPWFFPLTAAAGVVLAIGLSWWWLDGNKVELRDGPLHVTKRGEVVEDQAAIPEEYRAALPAAIKARRVEVAGAPGLAELAPVGMTPSRTAVDVDDVWMHWTPQPGTARCEWIIVADSGGAVIRSGPLPGTQPKWHSKTPLTRGDTYRWRVVLYDADGRETGVLPDARGTPFRVLPAESAAKVAAARRTIGTSHLALGLFFAREGMREAAAVEFDALAKANPESKLARDFLASVQ